MDVSNNQDVGTPDGDGIVVGRTDEGKIVVRLRNRKAVKGKQGKTTFGGWQFEYAPGDLRVIPVKARR